MVAISVAHAELSPSGFALFFFHLKGGGPIQPIDFRTALAALIVSGMFGHLPEAHLESALTRAGTIMMEAPMPVCNRNDLYGVTVHSVSFKLCLRRFATTRVPA